MLVYRPLQSKCRIATLAYLLFLAATKTSILTGCHAQQPGVSTYFSGDDGEERSSITTTSQRQFHRTMTQQAMGYFDITAKNFSRSSSDITSGQVCYRKDDLVQQQNVPDMGDDMLYIIGFEPIVSTDLLESSGISHFLVRATERPNCNEGYYLDDLLYYWIPGQEAWQLPDTVGAPLFGVGNSFNGGLNGYRSISLEIHYHDHTLYHQRNDTMDGATVGVRMHYTSTPRQHQLGILQLGDPSMELLRHPSHILGDSVFLSQHTFDCPTSCTNLALQHPIPDLSLQHTLTVFHETFHMGYTGILGTNHLLRNNQVIRLGTADRCDANQSSTSVTVPQVPYEIEPGDAFRTTCYYHNDMTNHDNTNITLGRRSSEQELCISYLAYYPRIRILKEFYWMCPHQYFANGYLSDCDASYEHENIPIDESDRTGSFCSLVELETPVLPTIDVVNTTTTSNGTPPALITTPTPTSTPTSRPLGLTPPSLVSSGVAVRSMTRVASTSLFCILCFLLTNW